MVAVAMIALLKGLRVCLLDNAPEKRASGQNFWQTADFEADTAERNLCKLVLATIDGSPVMLKREVFPGVLREARKPVSLDLARSRPAVYIGHFPHRGSSVG
ncbi:MAG TPA: hypothetical protein VGZ47_08850 [Gemmataceae bacterium]|nr:hypothetical protein [Gemmataceae bacterium]